MGSNYSGIKSIFFVMSIMAFSAYSEIKTVVIKGGEIVLAPLIVNPSGNNPMEIVPTDKVSAAHVTLRFHCHQKIDNAQGLYEGCKSFKVNSQPVGTYLAGGKRVNLYTKDIYPRAVEGQANKFRLDDTVVEYSSENGGHLCMLIAAPNFKGLPDQAPDNIFYFSNNRYSLSSYCTSWEIPKWGFVPTRFGNREFEFKGFQDKLSKTIPLLLDGKLLKGLSTGD